MSDADEFPRDVLELIDFMSDEPEQTVKAVPGRGAKVPVWILGSSHYGAQLAAMLGLPYAFASHFAPQALMPAIELYRSLFKPSKFLAKPYVMCGFNVFAAETDEEARVLATSWQQSFVNLRSGRPGRLPPPRPGFYEQSTGAERALLDMILTCTAIGSSATVRERIREFVAETRADELMIAGAMFDHEARLRSYEIAAQAAI
jgi:luciferase family oxidoreductase group 1